MGDLLRRILLSRHFARATLTALVIGTVTTLFGYAAGSYLVLAGFIALFMVNWFCGDFLSSEAAKEILGDDDDR